MRVFIDQCTLCKGLDTLFLMNVDEAPDHLLSSERATRLSYAKASSPIAGKVLKLVALHHMRCFALNCHTTVNR